MGSIQKAIYGMKGALDNSISLPSRCSSWLNIIREFRRLSQKGTDLFPFVKKVGNGEGTSFWEDRWLFELPLKCLYPRVFRLELEKHVSVAFKLRDMSLISSFRRAPRGGIDEDEFVSFMLV